jgi:hypothetical protein
VVKSYDRPIQAVRPSTITKLYRDLLTSGGRDGQPLAVAIVTHLHAVLRKAFRDAVIVDEFIGSSPVERAKWPRAQTQEPDRSTPDTVTSLMPKLIRVNKQLPTHVCTTCGICTRQPCCSRASRSMSSRPASGTPTRLFTLRVYAHVIRLAEAAAATFSPNR